MTSQSAEPIPASVRAWLIFTSIVCSIDVAFTMLRPASLRGGSLGWLFKGWHIYADVDLRYATTNDLVTHTTERLMLVEIGMNILALIMSRRQSRHALLTAFTTTAFVLWKTLVYFLLFICVPEGNPNEIAEGTSILKMLLVFWLPNGIWVAVPLAVMVYLWPMLAR